MPTFLHRELALAFIVGRPTEVAASRTGTNGAIFVELARIFEDTFAQSVLRFPEVWPSIALRDNECFLLCAFELMPRLRAAVGGFVFFNHGSVGRPPRVARQANL